MLSTYQSSNIPMVMGYNGEHKLLSHLLIFHYNDTFLGEVDDDINFTYETNTEVFGSCAASLNDEMWVLGGYYQKRQVNFLIQKSRYVSSFNDNAENKTQ